MTSAPLSPDPALGPRILFFSGGTALRGLSRLLSAWTHRSIHLITPFDSGGSSAALRQALEMPAVGDLRNRILALADVAAPGGRELHDHLAHRLPADGAPAAFRRELGEAARRLPATAARHLRTCLEAVGTGFDLRHASVGNLVLAGIYLAEGRSLGRAAEILSELVGARGTVRPVVEDNLHLAAELADGTIVVGQHRITRWQTEWGEAPATAGARAHTFPAPIARVFIVRGPDDPTPADTTAPAEILDLIGNADLVCFPMGSFFTSVVASLLPAGIGRAVGASPVPKVYLPNAGTDPEERGLGLDDRVRVLSSLLASLDATDIRVMDPVARSADDPSRYDDAAVLGALERVLPLPWTAGATSRRTTSS